MNRAEPFEFDPPAAAAVAEHVRDLRRRALSPYTIKQRVGVVRRFAASIAPRPLLGARAGDVEAWIDGQLARDVPVQTRHTYLAHLRQFFSWCARRGLTPTDPTVDQVPARVPRALPRPIPEDDLRLALVTAGQPLRAWLVLAAYCGLRAGEIARVRREHVLDVERPPLLLVAEGKGGKSRLLPLSAGVLAELGPHLTGRRGPLWPLHNTNPAKRVTELVSGHFRGLGLPYTCHQLRHRFGTQVYQRSRDLRMTQDLLGHASPATTQIYAAWDTGRGVEILDELGDGIAPDPLATRRDRGPR